jgi:hypothetical protein
MVSIMSREDVLGLLGGIVEVSLAPDVERGEILIDSHGNGSFQRHANYG